MLSLDVVALQDDILGNLLNVDFQKKYRLRKLLSYAGIPFLLGLRYLEAGNRDEILSSLRLPFDKNIQNSDELPEHEAQAAQARIPT